MFTADDHYKAIYSEAFDTIITKIMIDLTRKAQMYSKLEKLLQKNCDEHSLVEVLWR